jgi:hypothetical protein
MQAVSSPSPLGEGRGEVVFFSNPNATFANVLASKCYKKTKKNELITSK